MRLFSWPGLVVAAAYSGVVTWFLLSMERDTDPEAITYAWAIFGAPWIGVVGQYPWLAVAMNGLTLYILIILFSAVYRKAVELNSKQSPPSWSGILGMF